MFISYFFWITAIILVGLQLINHWYLGKGRLNIVYPVSIVCYILYIVVETALALSNPAQLGIILFNLVNFWALYNAVKGYLRLRQERKDV